MGRRFAVLALACAFLSTLPTALADDAASDLDAANAEADRIHSNGKTALMAAAKSGDKGRIETLIEQGADVNRTNDNGGTPIMYAVLSRDTDTVSLLLKHGADVNAVAENGWTALMIASAKGYSDIARLLLEHGARPDIPDIYSWTPLMRAVYERRLQIVKLLVARQATRVNRIGENGLTALHLAALKGDQGIAKVLLAAGADPAIHDDYGRTALDFAKKNKDLEMEELIRSAGRD